MLYAAENKKKLGHISSCIMEIDWRISHQLNVLQQLHNFIIDYNLTLARICLWFFLISFSGSFRKIQVNKFFLRVILIFPQKCINYLQIIKNLFQLSGDCNACQHIYVFFYSKKIYWNKKMSQGGVKIVSFWPFCDLFHQR